MFCFVCLFFVCLFFFFVFFSFFFNLFVLGFFKVCSFVQTRNQSFEDILYNTRRLRTNVHNDISFVIELSTEQEVYMGLQSVWKLFYCLPFQREVLSLILSTTQSTYGTTLLTQYFNSLFSNSIVLRFSIIIQAYKSAK